MESENPMSPGNPHETEETRYRNGTRLCNAKKNTCCAFVVRGKTKCHYHGGATPKGPAHGAYETGKYSKFLGHGIKAKYAEAISDPTLTEYRADIALLQSRLYQLLETGESLPLWEGVAEAYNELRYALNAKDPLGLGNSLAQLDDLLKRGLADSIRWQEIYQVAEQMTKIKEREHKRLIAAQQMVSAEQFMAFIQFIIDVAQKTITDRDQLRAFSAEIDRSWNRNAQQKLTAGH